MVRFLRPLVRQPFALACAALLAACASSPSVRAPVTTATPMPIFAARPAPPASAPLPRSVPPVAVASPVPSHSLPELAVASVPVPDPVPAAVAARFPEPAVTFATPAFAPGRQTFTTDEELHAILYGLERTSTIGEGGTEIRVVSLGASQSGRSIDALAFTRPGGEPAPGAPLDTATHRPTVVIVAGQHGDEPAGAEALIVVAQELASGRLAGVLDKVDVVLLPRANPDGAVAFTRDASDGTDINRDHLLLRTPEARAVTQLVERFAPIVVLDLHEYPVGGVFSAKFGAVQRFDAMLQYATVANLPPFVTRASEEWFRQPLVASLRGAGLTTDWYSTTSSDLADKTLAMGSIGAQVGRNAWGLRNAVSMLVETRGGGLGRVDLKRRVQAQTVAVASVLASASIHAADMVKLRQFVDRETASRACRGDVIVEAARTPSEYATSMIDRDTGAIRNVTVSWESALLLRTLKSRPRPCGYWLAPGETDAVARLRLLGVEVSQLDELAEMRGETYRETGREPIGSSAPQDAAVQAGAGTRVKVQTMPALLDLAVGSYYVGLDQPLANLIVAALEPEAPSSYVANGVIASVSGEARILLRPDARMTPVP
ncbi:MAG: M14 family metallocarboxypeptidase [Caldimonas sp.]